MSALAILGIVFVVLLLIKVPIAISLGLAASAAILIPGRFPTSVIPQLFTSATDSYTLIAIPFFILAGVLMEYGGLAKRLVVFADACVGHRRGGIGTVAIVCTMIFASISGSGVATVAALGGILIPAMVEAKYDKGYAAALMATAGGMGMILPPSIPMIVYAVQAEVSIGALFMAGIVPGVMFGVALIILNNIVSKRRNYQGRDFALSREKRVSAFWKALPALLMPIIILGSIYGGIATPTEAAVVAVVYGFLIGAFIYKDLKFRDVPKIFSRAAVTSATIMFIIMAAAIFSYVIIIENVPHMVVQWATGTLENKILILLFINIVLLLVGAFLDASSAIIVIAPLLVPLAVSIGVNPVHFGMIMVVNLAIGLITPPVGLNLFVASGIAKVSISTIIRNTGWLLVVTLIVLMLLTYIPEISLLLPRLLGLPV
jgi:C4-dicarboxylate transporter DctM subunit